MNDTLLVILSVALIFAMGLSCLLVCFAVILGYFYHVGAMVSEFDKHVASAYHHAIASAQSAERAEAAAHYISEGNQQGGEWEASAEDGQ